MIDRPKETSEMLKRPYMYIIIKRTKRKEVQSFIYCWCIFYALIEKTSAVIEKKKHSQRHRHIVHFLCYTARMCNRRDFWPYTNPHCLYVIVVSFGGTYKSHVTSPRKLGAPFVLTRVTANAIVSKQGISDCNDLSRQVWFFKNRKMTNDCCRQDTLLQI